jgi:hypothetical protein
VRQQLEQSQMPVEDAPDDDEVRQSYNFAPGYHGLVYRADGPDHGGQHGGKEEESTQVNKEGATDDTKYKLQAMQWYASRNIPSSHADDAIVGGLCLSGQSATRTMAAR